MAGWRIRDTVLLATVEVVSCSAVQCGDRWNIRLSQGRILDRSWLGAFDRWQNL